METEYHSRKAAQPGRAKCNYLKMAGNSEIQIFFKLKIPLCLIASTKIVLQFLIMPFLSPQTLEKLILHSQKAFM